MLSISGCSGIIISGDITPILPGSGEKLPDNITKHYFDALIYYMVSEVGIIDFSKGNPAKYF